MLKSASITRQPHPHNPLKWHALCPKYLHALNYTRTMKTLSRYPFLACLALLAGSLGCGNSKKTPEVANVAQDTMLLHDLAEANKNTAAAAAVDNSLNTVKTTGDQTLTPTQGAAPSSQTRAAAPSSQTPDAAPSSSTQSAARSSSPTPVTRVVPRPTASGNGGLVAARVTSDTSIVRVSARQAARTRPRAPSPSSSDPCDSPNPVDQRSCLNRLIVENDADLNQTYQELIAQSRKSGGPGLEERLRQSQREWINTRDVQCQGVGNGALWARERGRCLAGHSTRRTAELQRSLNSLRGQ